MDRSSLHLLQFQFPVQYQLNGNRIVSIHILNVLCISTVQLENNNLLVGLGLGGFGGSVCGVTGVCAISTVGLTLFAEVTTVASLAFSVSVHLRGPLTGSLGGRMSWGMDNGQDNWTSQKVRVDKGVIKPM